MHHSPNRLTEAACPQKETRIMTENATLRRAASAHRLVHDVFTGACATSECRKDAARLEPKP